MPRQADLPFKVMREAEMRLIFTGSEVLHVYHALIYMSAFKMQATHQHWEAVFIQTSDAELILSILLGVPLVLAAFTTLLWVYGHRRVRHACKLLLEDLTCRRRKVGCVGSAKAHARCCTYFQSLALPGNHAVK